MLGSEGDVIGARDEFLGGNQRRSGSGKALVGLGLVRVGVLASKDWL